MFSKISSFAIALFCLFFCSYQFANGQTQFQMNNTTIVIMPPAGYCPPNEVMLNCSFPPDCEPSCANPQPSQYCKQSCYTPRCHCQLGFVRATDGNCIPYENCPDPNCVAPRPCESGFNKNGECRCQCGVNERCQKKPTPCVPCAEQMDEDDAEWECVVATPCGQYQCTIDEECQLTNSTFMPQCVALNRTIATASPPASSSSPAGPSSSAGPSVPPSSLPSSASTPSASSSAPSSASSSPPPPSTSTSGDSSRRPSSPPPPSPSTRKSTTTTKPVCTKQCPYGKKCAIRNGIECCV